MVRFSWQTHEYVHKDKSSDWFWVLGIIAVAVAVTAIIFGNVLFAMVVIIGAFVFALFGARRPNIIEAEISDKGIRIDRTAYQFRSIKSFWIDDDHHHGPRLVIRTERAIMPYIIVQIDEQDADDMRAFLETKVKAEPFEDHPVYLFLERIGF